MNAAADKNLLTELQQRAEQPLCAWFAVEEEGARI